MATGSERDRRKNSSRRLFTKSLLHPYSLFDREPTAEVLFDFRHKMESALSRPTRPDDTSFLELTMGQFVKVNIGITHKLQNKDLLFGHILPPEVPNPQGLETTGCFPRNYVLPSVIPRIQSDELRLECFLGDGGFGSVYKHVYKGRMVAVKETSHRVSVDLLKEVNHEATILAKLSCLGSQEGRGDTHINLCRLLGVMVDIPFLQYSLVLEYCAGGELYQLLHKRKVHLDSYGLVLNYCTQIAEGLEYMHTSLDIPIIHRDLKTKNVLLLRDVDPSDPRTLETNTLKLIDFGLARELAKTHLTTDKGTYVYMAPEAIMFNRHSVSSDIWSLGVVLWELLVQVFPYPNIPEIMVLLGVARGLVSLPLPDTVPGDFRRLLQKCFMCDSESRGDIARLVKELKSMQRHRETLSPEAFQSLRLEWQAAAEAIHVNQTDLVPMGLEGNGSTVSSTNDTTAVMTKRQSQILDLRTSMPTGPQERNIEEEITKTQTEILDLRNNFQFSQVARVALAVTKFKKMAEIRKETMSIEVPAVDSVEVDSVAVENVGKRPEQTETPHTYPPVNVLGNLIPKEELDYLEQEFRLRQLQLELERTKLLVHESQRKVEQLKKRRFPFRFFSRSRNSIEAPPSEPDPAMSQAVSSLRKKPRSKTYGFISGFRSKSSQSKIASNAPKATVPQAAEFNFTPTFQLAVPLPLLPAMSAPSSPDSINKLDLPPIESQIKLSASDSNLNN